MKTYKTKKYHRPSPGFVNANELLFVSEFFGPLDEHDQEILDRYYALEPFEPLDDGKEYKVFTLSVPDGFPEYDEETMVFDVWLDDLLEAAYDGNVPGEKD